MVTTMYSYGLKIILLSCLIMQAGCNITLKKKTGSDKRAHPSKVMLKRNAEAKRKKIQEAIPRVGFPSSDRTLIELYFKNKGNESIFNNMVKQREVTKKTDKKLTVSNVIPNNIQVSPLPLDLEKTLSLAPSHMLRVQAGRNIILMYVKTRKIVDIIKF